jgi:hypothetical protein
MGREDDDQKAASLTAVNVSIFGVSAGARDR